MRDWSLKTIIARRVFCIGRAEKYSYLGTEDRTVSLRCPAKALQFDPSRILSGVGAADGPALSMCENRLSMRSLKLRIVLLQPPVAVDYGVQKGRGAAYECVQKQRSIGADLVFEFDVDVKPGPDFGGPFVQGPKGERFVYIDIGTMAGQADSCWTRRLKAPLKGITQAMIDSGATLETRINGTGRDGGPTCATPKPFAGWSECRPGF
jgi:hypothetical protein